MAPNLMWFGAMSFFTHSYIQVNWLTENLTQLMTEENPSKIIAVA